MSGSGECNPYGADPAFALYPAPDRSAGHRLCTEILGLKRHDYLDRFDRVNLCGSVWSHPRAVERASQLMRERDFLDKPATYFDKPDPRAVIILLGAKVCRAFRVPFEPFAEDATIGDPCLRVLVLPHPSGRCTLWNAAGSFERARKLLRDAGVLTVAGAAG